MGLKSIVSEWMDSIESSIHDGLVDIITSSLKTSQDMLSTGMNANKADDGIFHTFLSAHPSEFTGATDGTGTTIWSMMEMLCNNAVVPIAGLIIVVILLNDLIQQCMAGNNFRDFDTSIIFKWIVKCLIGVILISNIYYLTSGFLAFGTSATNAAMDTIFGSGSFITPASEIVVDGTDLGIGELFGILLMSGFLNLVIVALLVIMIIVLASRMIEIFMYLAISPVPIATLMNNEWGQIGRNWVRSVCALGFQGLFIVIALTIFQTLFSNVLANLATGRDVMMQMVILMGYSLALCFTILKTGNISKSVFNAH